MAQPALSLRARALRSLARREHTRSELRCKLAPHEETEGQLDALLDALQAQGFLSDERAAASLVHRRAARLGTQRLRQELQAKGLDARVHVRHFHKWVRDQLVAYHQLPDYADRWPVGKKMEEYVRCVISGVDKGHIPAGQYHAILIDEGHDFAPEWLQLVTHMVCPTTHSLPLVLSQSPCT